MSHFLYHTQEDFNQATIDNISRLWFDKAITEMADGHSCFYIIEQLKNLSTLANVNQCGTHILGTYLDMLETKHSGVEFTDKDV